CLLGGRDLSRRLRDGGDPAGRARSRRALQVVRPVRLRALCGRARPSLGNAGRAGSGADAARGHRAEGVAVRAAATGRRGHPRVRSTLSRTRPGDAPLAGRRARARVPGSAPPLRPRGHARAPALTHIPLTGIFPEGREALPTVFFLCPPSYAW